MTITDAQILVIAEHLEGRILPATYDALSFAMELGEGMDLRIGALIIGNAIEAPAHELARTAGVRVTGIQGQGLAPYNGEAWKGAAVAFLEGADPSYVCLPHTAMGFDLAPRLAFHLKAACITSVLKLDVTEGRPRFIRPMFNNKLLAEIAPRAEKTVFTVMPGTGSFSKVGSPSPGDVRIVKDDPIRVQTLTIGVKGSQKTGLNLSDAEVIVSAGRGIRKPENLRLLERLTEIFPGSVLASSKALCDQGWLPYKHQVGVTGQTVAPKLYLACGISGAPQHLAGMGGSHMVVAINIDPGAAIFNVADYCVVEDLQTFIPVLLNELKRISLSKAP